MRDAIIAKKKLKKIIEYINAMLMDIQEGSLKRVKPSRHPVKRLDQTNLSDDSDELPDGTFFEAKGITSMNSTYGSREETPFTKNKSTRRVATEYSRRV